MTLETATQRAILTENMQKFETELFALRIERTARLTMLGVATASKLKMGRYTKGDNKPAVTELERRLAQIEFDIEFREIAVAEMQAALDALPPEETERERDDDAAGGA